MSFKCYHCKNTITRTQFTRKKMRTYPADEEGWNKRKDIVRIRKVCRGCFKKRGELFC